MSFRRYQTEIREGDTVILYMSNNLYALEVLPQKKNKMGELCENIFQTCFGALKVRRLIGAKFGSRVELSKGWAHVLQPTPELWSLTLPHRTQIIYTPDISMILFELDLAPGNVVIEAGTGSGSLSHAIIKIIKPYGHLYTFDFHEFRARTAREEFIEHGLDEWVCTARKDVLQDGFGEELYGEADAVFLDLPRPWECIPEVVNVFKDRGGRFCSFSPCIEQVQRTSEALNNNGFVQVRHMEILQYQLRVYKKELPVRDLSFLKHKGSKNPVAEKPDSEKPYVMATLPSTMPGHTGYITVGTLPPVFRRAKKRHLDIEVVQPDCSGLEKAESTVTAANPKLAKAESNSTAAP